MPSPIQFGSVPIREVEQRARRYWFEDGLAILVAGLTALLISGLLLIDRRQGSNLLSVALGFLLIMLYCTALLRQRELVEWLKSKITYPRTGYVRSPFAEEQNRPLDLTMLDLEGPEEGRRVQGDRSRRGWLVVVLTAFATIAIMMIRSPWICAVTSVGISAALWTGARKFQQLSWIVFAGLPFLGFYLAMSRLGKVPGPDRGIYFLIGLGLLFALEGTVSLLRYLRQNPRPKASDL